MLVKLFKNILIDKGLRDIYYVDFMSEFVPEILEKACDFYRGREKMGQPVTTISAVGQGYRSYGRERLSQLLQRPGGLTPVQEPQLFYFSLPTDLRADYSLALAYLINGVTMPFVVSAMEKAGWSSATVLDDLNMAASGLPLPRVELEEIKEDWDPRFRGCINNTAVNAVITNLTDRGEKLDYFFQSSDRHARLLLPASIVLHWGTIFVSNRPTNFFLEEILKTGRQFMGYVEEFESSSH